MASRAAGGTSMVSAAQEGFLQVKFQSFISIAGVSDRPDVHVLFINPTLNYLPARRWVVQADVESNNQLEER